MGGGVVELWLELAKLAMEDSENAPLVKRTDFKPLEGDGAEPVVVQCCCVESTRLGKVPVIKTLFKKKDPSEKVKLFLSYCR